MIDGTIETSFRVGKRFIVTCRIRVDMIRSREVGEMEFIWDPATPKRLWPNEVADYRRGRDAFLAEMATLIGGNVVVGETGTGKISVFEPETKVVT